MLDSLHAAGIEIVSPNFMNTRAISDDRLFVPKPSRKVAPAKVTQAEELAFDKAEEAASAEEIRKSIELVDAEITALKEQKTDAAAASVDKLAARKDRLVEQLKIADEQLKD